MSHLKITQASLVSALVFIVGQLVAFVPSLGPDKQNLISAGTAVIAAVFLIANAIHTLASSKAPSVAELEGAAQRLAQDAVGKIDLNTLAKDAISGQNIGALVQAEVQRILSAAAKPSVTATATSSPTVAADAPAA